MIIIKYLVLSLLALLMLTASDPHFGAERLFSRLPKTEKEDLRQYKWLDTNLYEPYLKDHDSRVNPLFHVKPYYYPNVKFWFLIYTQFGSDQVVIHDRDNLNLIYMILDFSHLHSKEVPRNTLYVVQQKLSSEKVQEIKNDLDHLISNPFSLEPRAIALYQILKRAKVEVPIAEVERITFFKNLKSNLRSQTGQRNFIRDGIIRSLPYQHFLTTYFERTNLPKELLAIAFLESSFNPKAHSKVNALGVWQFMPHISVHFVPKRTTLFDYRSNVAVASLAAASLLKQNHRIMKSWDLAVTAYNSGTRHLLKTKRELASEVVALEDIIRHSDSKHFGFASKNFYSEFLALAHTLAYREELFNDLHEHDRSDVNYDIRFYLSKCSLRLDRILNKDQLDDVKFHNHQISNLKATFPRGHIITTKGELPKSKFFEISDANILKVKPKDWDRFLRNQSCSMR